MAEQTNYRERVIKHLEEWKKDQLPGVGDGFWKGKPHAHILPVPDPQRIVVEDWNLLSVVYRKYLDGVPRSGALL